MPKKFKYVFFLLLTLTVLLFVHGSFAAADSQGDLVSPGLLEQAGLKILWEQKLPIKKGETLERLLILDNRIYVITNKHYVVSLNRENGNRIFGRSFSPDSMPKDGLQLCDNKLVSVAGSRIIAIDPTSGIERRLINAGFGIVCPVAGNSKYFYMSGVDRRLHAFSVEEKVQIFEVAADNDSMITSVIADEDFAVFGTDEGNVVSIASGQRPVRLWQFDAAGPIVGPVIRDGRSLFFACSDTNIYRIDMVGEPEKVRLVWKYQTNGILDKEPRVTKNVIYQYVPTKGVTAIDKGGSFLWSVPGGLDLLAESNGRAYVITENSKLVVMDNIGAKTLYSVNFTGVFKHAFNIKDSKIYIADKSGLLTCLQPTQ